MTYTPSNRENVLLGSLVVLAIVAIIYGTAPPTIDRAYVEDNQQMLQERADRELTLEEVRIRAGMQARWSAPVPDLEMRNRDQRADETRLYQLQMLREARKD